MAFMILLVVYVYVFVVLLARPTKCEANSCKLALKMLDISPIPGTLLVGLIALREAHRLYNLDPFIHVLTLVYAITLLPTAIVYLIQSRRVKGGKGRGDGPYQGPRQGWR